MQLPIVLRQGQLALFAAFFLVIPFALGFWITAFPRMDGLSRRTVTTRLRLVHGYPHCVQLPVIAEGSLMDPGPLQDTDPVCMLIMAAAMFSDWLAGSSFPWYWPCWNRGVGTDWVLTILYIFLFGMLMLTVGRKLLNHFVPFAQLAFTARRDLALPWVLSDLRRVYSQCRRACDPWGLHLRYRVGDCVHCHERARKSFISVERLVSYGFCYVSIG